MDGCQSSLEQWNGIDTHTHTTTKSLSAIAACQQQRTGGTTFTCKTEALIWAVLLEAGYGDRRECLEAYSDQVISCVTDQGALANLN